MAASARATILVRYPVHTHIHPLLSPNTKHLIGIHRASHVSISCTLYPQILLLSFERGNISPVGRVPHARVCCVRVFEASVVDVSRPTVCLSCSPKPSSSFHFPFTGLDTMCYAHTSVFRRVASSLVVVVFVSAVDRLVVSNTAVLP